MALVISFAFPEKDHRHDARVIASISITITAPTKTIQPSKTIQDTIVAKNL
jgi:hypothetical protein